MSGRPITVPDLRVGQRPPVDAAMKEATLLAIVRRIAKRGGWLVYHTHRSDRSEPGWPDLVLVHVPTSRLLVVELKATKGRISPAQAEWIGALSGCGVDVRVWRPAQLDDGEIETALNPYPPAPTSQTPETPR